MKKTTASILLFVLCLLSSCGSSEGKTQENTAKTVDLQTDALETDCLDVLPAMDCEGTSFRMFTTYLYSDNDNFPSETSTGEIVNDTMLARNQTVESRYNVDLVCENFGASEADAVTKLQTEIRASIMAGDHSYDVIVLPLMGGASNLMLSHCLYDLKTLPHLNPDREWWCQTIYENMQIDDRLLLTSGPIVTNFYYTPYVLAFNIEKASALDYTDIYDTVLSGKWTFDTFTYMIKDLASDLNGDSKMDQADFYGAAIDDVAGYGFYVSSGFRFVDFSGSTPDVGSIGTDTSVSFIEHAAEILGDTSRVLRAEKFKTSLAGAKYNTEHFMSGNCLFLGSSMDAIIRHGRNFDFDYGIIPCPKYDESQENYLAFANPWVNSMVAVPADCTTPERTGLILEALATLSYRDVRPAMYNTLLKEKIARDEKTQKTLDLIYDRVYYDMGGTFNFGGSFMLVKQLVLGEKKNAASSLEAIRSKCDKEIEKTMETLRSEME